MTPSLDQLRAALLRLVKPLPSAAGPEPVPADQGPANAATAATGPAPGASATTGAPPAAAMPAARPEPCQLVEFKARGFHLDTKVAPDQVVAVAELLDQHGFAMDSVTGVDWLAAGEMEIIYDYFHPTAGWQVVVRTRVPRSQPELPTISGVFPGANWHERETHEFFGIRFVGHPNLTPLLLPEDATYHPLRKDFAGAA